MTEKTKLEQVFDLFVSKREEKFASPFADSGKVFATDKYSVVFTDSENCDFPVVETEIKKPNLAHLVFTPNISKTISFDGVDFEALKTEDEREDNVDCEECNGTGEVTWEYKSWHNNDECPNCKGEGTFQGVKTGKKTFPSRKYVAINDAMVLIDEFYKLAQAQQVLSSDVSLTYYLDSEHMLGFKIHNLSFVIMSNYNASDGDIVLAAKFIDQ